MKYADFLLHEKMNYQFVFLDDKGKTPDLKDFQKVQILMNSYDVDNSYGFKSIVSHSLYKLVELSNLEEIDPNMPTLNMGTVSFVQKLINDGLINTANLYNKPEDKTASADKKLFHMVLKDADFLPKTVFTVKDTKKLKFPIIAKPASGHSGIGITKFQMLEDLELDGGEKFDLFSEAINIKDEIRLVFVNDELVSFMERESRDEKSKFLQGKSDSMGDLKPEDKLDFLYHIHLPEEIYYKFPRENQIDEIHSILKEIRKKIPLEFLTLDLAIDDNGKMWVIEINTEPGSSGVMLSNTYRAIFKDHYGKDIREADMPYFRDVEMKLIQHTLQNDKYQLSKIFTQKYIK
jgi:glutathionylspermidine synthase